MCPAARSARDAVAKIMGVEAGTAVKMRAVVQCQGSCDKVKTKYEYQGLKTCAAVTLYGGPSACSFGCMGYGDCVKACKFDAIHVVDGVSVVDPDKCTGCGECAKACPKGIIAVRPVSAAPAVLCSNKEKGVATRKACTVGCIGCMKCVQGLSERSGQGREQPCPHRPGEMHCLRRVREELPGWSNPGSLIFSS